MKRFRTISTLVVASAALLSTQLKADSLSLKIDDSSIDRTQNVVPASYANMLEEATPAVVAVHTARIVNVARAGQGLSPEEEMLRRFFGMPSPQEQDQGQSSDAEKRRLPQGIGSGVIVSKDGYIITNHHVVSDQRGGQADEVLVQLNDGREYKAEIVGSDPLTDVAIIKIDADDLPAITVADSENIKVGDIVFAIGNPMGVGLTVTQGIISAKNRSIGIYGETGYENFIQTDASINPGNSGGALIDCQGRLIGINSAILSRTGGNIGIGFAIPTNLAVNISKQLADSGEVKRGFLGVRISNLSPEMAELYELENTKGILIDEVEEGSAADQGGLKRGDLVLTIDGKEVNGINDFRIRIGNTIPGTELSFGIVRDQDKKDLKIEIGEASGRFAAAANELVEGVTVAAITDENASKYRLPEDLKGILITSVDAESRYSRSLREGMVLLEINDREVSSISDARDALRTGVNKLYIYDRGRSGYTAIRVE